jgi:hypothetical protein
MILLLMFIDAADTARRAAANAKKMPPSPS